MSKEAVRELVLEVPANADPREALEEGLAALHDFLRLPLPGEPGFEDEDPDGGFVGKAVAPHPAHYRQRSGGRFVAGEHHSRVQARGARGRFRQRLTQGECAEAGKLAEDHLKDLRHRLAVHAGLLQGGHVDAQTFHALCRMELETFYPLLYRTGKQAAGDPGIVLTGQDKAVVNALLRDEMDFLAGFAADAAEGRGRVPYGERADMYARAAAEMVYLGWLFGDQRRGRKIRWRFGPTEEHCSDCARFEKAGWMPVAEFIKKVAARGYMPRSGRLECVGVNCLCWLQESLGGVEREGLRLEG